MMKTSDKPKPTQFPIEFLFKRLMKDYKQLKEENRQLKESNAEMEKIINATTIEKQAELLAQKEVLYQQLRTHLKAYQKKYEKTLNELRKLRNENK